MKRFKSLVATLVIGASIFAAGSLYAANDGTQLQCPNTKAACDTCVCVGKTAGGSCCAKADTSKACLKKCDCKKAGCPNKAGEKPAVK